MTGTDKAAVISDRMKRDFLALALVLAKMPANLFDRPFKGAIAVAELLRITRAANELGGRLSWTDGELVFPLPPLEAREGKLLFGEVVVPVRQVLFHRSVTAGFACLLLHLQEQDRERLALVCAEGAPLLEDEGLKLIRRHFQRIAGGDGQLADLAQEVEGVAELLHQANPLESMMGREEGGGAGGGPGRT